MGPDTEVTVRPSPGVTAAVNAEPTRTMYLDGIPIQVPESRIGELQARGAMLYGPADLEALPGEIDLLLDQVKESIHRFVDGVLQDKSIDTSDGAEAITLQRGMNQASARIQELINVVFFSFPVREARESAQARRERQARDMAVNGWSQAELQRRYGLDDDEADAVANTEISMAPMAEPHARLSDSDEYVPLSQVKGADKDRIVEVTTTPPTMKEG
jgi:hypothetical protein